MMHEVCWVPHLLVDQGGSGQAVEAVREGAPEANVVAPLALVVEAVNAVDRRALVVSAQQEKVFGVSDLRSGSAWQNTAQDFRRRIA